LTAPGDSLEFREGRDFAQQVRDAQELAEAIKEACCNNPLGRGTAAGKLLRGEVTWEGRSYEFLFARGKGNRVYLFKIRDLAKDGRFTEEEIKRYSHLAG
jgi:hypothetical protein